MAIYLVDGILIRASNGNHAREIAERPDAEVLRITEEGDHGIVAMSAPADEAQDAEPDDEERDEIETTSLSDKGVRRFKDKKTGKERTEKKS